MFLLAGPSCIPAPVLSAGPLFQADPWHTHLGKWTVLSGPGTGLGNHLSSGGGPVKDARVGTLPIPGCSLGGRNSRSLFGDLPTWAKHWLPCTHRGEPVHNGLHEALPDVRKLPLPFLSRWQWRGWSQPKPWSSTTICETFVVTHHKVQALGQPS